MHDPINAPSMTVATNPNPTITPRAVPTVLQKQACAISEIGLPGVFHCNGAYDSAGDSLAFSSALATPSLYPIYQSQFIHQDSESLSYATLDQAGSSSISLDISSRESLISLFMTQHGLSYGTSTPASTPTPTGTSMASSSSSSTGSSSSPSSTTSANTSANSTSTTPPQAATSSTTILSSSGSALPSTSASAQSSSDSQSGPNLGPIIGGAVGGGVALLLLAMLAFFLMRRKRNRNTISWKEHSTYAYNDSYSQSPMSPEMARSSNYSAHSATGLNGQQPISPTASEQVVMGWQQQGSMLSPPPPSTSPRSSRTGSSILATTATRRHSSRTGASLTVADRSSSAASSSVQEAEVLRIASFIQANPDLHAQLLQTSTESPPEYQPQHASGSATSQTGARAAAESILPAAVPAEVAAAGSSQTTAYPIEKQSSNSAEQEQEEQQQPSASQYVGKAEEGGAALNVVIQ